jgi:hypothetical protein
MMFATTTLQIRVVLACIPQVIPFEQRYDVFQALLRTDKERYQQSQGAAGRMHAIGLGGTSTSTLSSSFSI